MATYLQNRMQGNCCIFTRLIFQNGTIIDALTLFASNAKAYFANLNDCAICYGVVAVDRTLPSKKCPNGHWFHAICLYKVVAFHAVFNSYSGSKVLMVQLVLYVISCLHHN